MRKTLITITINDDELDLILPEGTPKVGVRRAKVASNVCSEIVQSAIATARDEKKAAKKIDDAPKAEPKEEAPKKETTKKTTKKTATKK